MRMSELNTTKSFQERLEEVFPTFKGTEEEMINSAIEASREQDLCDAYDYADNFDPSIATEYDWQKLDWAFSVPGFVELYPELAFQTQAWLEDHYTLKISHRDFVELINKIIICATNVANDTKNAETTIPLFKESFEKLLPEELSLAVTCLLEKEMCNQCSAKGLPVDKEIMEKYFYTLQA